MDKQRVLQGENLLTICSTFAKLDTLFSPI